jgi:hypothetical protein
VELTEFSQENHGSNLAKSKNSVGWVCCGDRFVSDCDKKREN